MLAHLGLSLLLAAASASAQEAGVPAEPRPIARVWLRGEDLDPHALAGAVAARLGDKEVLRAGAEARPHSGLVAQCHVTLGADRKTLQLEIVLGDGRVYRRRIVAPPGDRERAAARLISATLTAIEDGSVAPDRRDGVLDLATAPDQPTPTTVPEPTTPRTEPLPEPRPALTPSPRPEPRPEPTPSPVREPVPAAPSTSPPELGVALELGPMFGLGAPATGLGLASGGGGLRLDLRLRRGLALGAGVRAHTRRRDDLALTRVRAALHLGHVWRRGAFELAALAGVALETWQLRQRGAPVTYTASGPDGPAVLLGGLARLAPGARLSPARRALALRLGAFVELAAGARGSGRAAQLATSDGHGAASPRFVLGGAELALGLELELWFRLIKPGPRARPRRAPPARPAAP